MKQSNSYQNQKIRGLKRKYEYILSQGGKCEFCGYNKNIAALEFHHKNPNEKEFQIDLRRFSNCNIQKLEKELNKCMILCANCHREIHNLELTIEQVEKTTQESNVISFNNKFGRVCFICEKRFPKIKGKKYCSKECRIKAQGKDKYPSKEELEIKYKEIGSWQKVANHYKLTRRIIQRIRLKDIRKS